MLKQFSGIALSDFIEQDENYIYNLKNIDQKSTKIQFSGKKNFILIPDEVNIKNTLLDFRASNSICFINSSNLRANIMLGHGCIVCIGKDTTFTNTCNIVAAEGHDIFIGDECMIAESVYITNTDGHPIYDASGNRLNKGKSTYIGDHVWIGRGSEILKGVKIYSGSIIGARSVVTKDTPSNSVSVGNPSRTIMNGVTFSRQTTLRRPEKDYELPPHQSLYPEESLGDIEKLKIIRDLISSLYKE